MARSRTSASGREGPDAQLTRVGVLVDDLRRLGFRPVLVGGMALVVLGSRRVTRDFDFVLASPGDRLAALVEVLYGSGLELAARLDAEGDVSATIDNPRVATARLRIDAPQSAFFFDRATRFRVDLLFDFPVPADELAARATRLTIQSHEIDVASADDLLRLKKVALSRRTRPGDADDIAYLKRLLKAKQSDAT